MLKYYSCKLIPIIFIFLTNCTLIQNLSSIDETSFNKLWLKNQQKISKLTNFTIRGILVLRNSNHSNKYYAKLFFQQIKDNDYHLLLSNILGLTELDIYIKNNKNKIIDRNGNKYINTNPIVTINKLTGILLPIYNIPYWIKGLPINTLSFKLNNNALLKTIKYNNQENLNINYLSYTTKEKIKLPNIIKINYNNNLIVLKLYEWILN